MADPGLNNQKIQIIEWYSQDEVSVEEIVQRLNQNGQEYTVEQVNVHLRTWDAFTEPHSLNVQVYTSSLSRQFTPSSVDSVSSSDQPPLAAHQQISFSNDGVTSQNLSSLPCNPTPFEKYYKDKSHNDPFYSSSIENEFLKETVTVMMESRNRQSGNISKIMSVIDGAEADDPSDDVHEDIEVSSGSVDLEEICKTATGPEDGSLTSTGMVKDTIIEVDDNDDGSELLGFEVRAAEQYTSDDSGAITFRYRRAGNRSPTSKHKFSKIRYIRRRSERMRKSMKGGATK